MTRVSIEEFKKLISGSKTKKEIYAKHIDLGIAPAIIISYSLNKIVVSGDFSLSEDLVFQNGEVYEKEIVFDGGVYKNIIFRGGSFKKIIFRRGDFNGFVSIRGGKIENLILLGGNFKHWLGTLNGISNIETADKMLAEDFLSINRFEIEGGSYDNNIWISGGKIESLEIKCVTAVKIHCKPNDDKIFDTEKNKYTDRFASAPDIRNLVVSRYSNKDNFFHFSGLKLETIKFENFTNIGIITIAKIKLEKFICFENSDLGKTSFIDCDFSRQKMYFDSSKITEVALAGATLPAPAQIISNSKSLTQKKLALSQIKKVYQNMGDSVTAGQYQGEELNVYMKTLSFGAEKVNLWLNHQTNRHGQSWARAIKILFLGSILFYTFYCFALGFKINFSKQGMYMFFKNLSYFLEFLNPIRKGEFLPKVLIGIKDESQIPLNAVIIDSLAKLFNAYLIYQLIAAFRKHGKKSE
jgi:hypothetical protein